jgi:mono/diheme cytochrome c family protein
MKKLLMISLVILSACYYDNEEELYPNGSAPCDTTNVTYSGTVFPIIQANCIGCHSGAAPQGNVLLEDYNSISAAGQIPEGQYGSLYGVISHASGNSPMPKNGNKLPDCDIQKIKKWIDDGTPNN